MRNLKQILILQRAYGVAANYLAHIGAHPSHVEQGHIGYFMTIENIKEVIKSFDPHDWYTGEMYEGTEVTFSALPIEAQCELTDILNNLTSNSMSQSHLIEKCSACWRLSLQFGYKILELLKKKNLLKQKAA